jgi:hypothetical protein
MLIPLQTLPKLRISLQKKISLILLFTLGSFAIIASIIRTVLFVKDATLAKVVVWSFVEEVVFFVVANGPILRPLFFRGSNFESSSNNTRPGAATHGRTGHDLYELAHTEGGVVSVVSAGGKRKGEQREGVIRTVEVIVKSERKSSESSENPPWMA